MQACCLLSLAYVPAASAVPGLGSGVWLAGSFSGASLGGQGRKLHPRVMASRVWISVAWGISEEPHHLGLTRPSQLQTVAVPLAPLAHLVDVLQGNFLHGKQSHWCSPACSTDHLEEPDQVSLHVLPAVLSSRMSCVASNPATPPIAPLNVAVRAASSFAKQRPSTA